MANPATFASGSQAATIGTEHFLSSPNAVGTYILNLDLNVLQAGDVLEIRIYKMVLTGGTPRVVYLETFQGVQPTDAQNYISVPIGNALTDTNSLRFSLKQTQPAGGGRTFDWSVEQYT